MRHYYGDERRKDIEWGKRNKRNLLVWEENDIRTKHCWMSFECDILFGSFLPQSWLYVCFCFLFASLLPLFFPMPFWTVFVCYILILFWIFFSVCEMKQRWQGLTQVFMFCPRLSGFCVLMILLLSVMFFSSAGNANSGAVIRNCSAPPSQQARISNDRKQGRQITWANANARLPPTSVQNLYNVSSNPTKKTTTLNFSWTKII